MEECTLLIPEKSILICTFIGMKAEEISIAGKLEITILLAEDIIGLDEIAVIRY